MTEALEIQLAGYTFNQGTRLQQLSLAQNLVIRLINSPDCALVLIGN